jgi:hypothetical protein
MSAPNAYPVPFPVDGGFLPNLVTANREAIERSNDLNSTQQAQYGIAGVLATKQSENQVQRDVMGSALQLQRDIKEAQVSGILSTQQASVAGLLATKDTENQIQRDVKEAQVTGILSTQQSAVAGVLATKDGAYQLQRDIKEAQVAGVLSSQQNGSDTREAVYRESASNRQTTDRNGYANEVTTNRVASAILAQGADTASQMFLGQKDIQLEDAKNYGRDQYKSERRFAETTLRAADSERRTQRDAFEWAARAQLDASRHYEQTGRQLAESALRAQFELASVSNRLERQASDNVASIQLKAAKHEAKLQAKLAECCCEIKEHIGMSADKTQDMIRGSEIMRLRDELAEARAQRRSPVFNVSSRSGDETPRV